MPTNTGEPLQGKPVGNGYYIDGVTGELKIIPFGYEGSLQSAPTLGKLPAGPELSVRGGGNGMPYQVGQGVSGQQAQQLQNQGYRVSGPDRFGTYTIISAPAGGGGLSDPGGGGGGGEPITRRDAGDTTSTSQQNSTSLANRTDLNELPPDVRKEYLNYLSQFGGLAGRASGVAEGAIGGILAAPGYTEAERAEMLIDPEEAARITRSAIDPTVGAAENARQNLLAYTAASGNFNPGLNASMQEIQREQGRQASKAALAARLGVAGANRLATEAAANARVQDRRFGTGQAGNLLQTGIGATGNLLTSFPERRGSGTVQSSATGLGSNVTQNRDVTTTGPSTQLGAAPGLTPTGPATKPSWMSASQWQDFLDKNPQPPIGGTGLPPVAPAPKVLGPKREAGGMAYAY